jgi:hypothetical protein
MCIYIYIYVYKHVYIYLYIYKYIHIYDDDTSDCDDIGNYSLFDFECLDLPLNDTPRVIVLAIDNTPLLSHISRSFISF